MDSDDSQVDIFATQVPPKKKKELRTLSAPLYTGPNPSGYVYPWLIIFRWGGDIGQPFVLFSVEELAEGELDPKILTGILSSTSRMKHRDLGFFPDFSISIFSKLEKCKFHFLTYQHFAEKSINHSPTKIGNSKIRRESILCQLNERYNFLLKQQKDIPDFQIDNVFGQMIDERPYRILDSTEFDYSKVK